jgi:hypothetical protein
MAVLSAIRAAKGQSTEMEVLLVLHTAKYTSASYFNPVGMVKNDKG